MGCYNKVIKTTANNKGRNEGATSNPSLDSRHCLSAFKLSFTQQLAEPPIPEIEKIIEWFTLLRGKNRLQR
jgi:hypothetical protein